MTPLIFSLVVGTGLSTAVAIYGWSRRSAPGATLLVPLLASAALWSGSVALELLATSDEAKLLWSHVAWLGLVPLPLLWFLFCLDFTSASTTIRPARAVLLLASPALVALLLWVGSSLGPGQSTAGSALDPTHLLIALVELYGWLLAAVGMALLARRFARSASIYRGQCAVLMVAGAIPFVVHGVHVLGLDPFQGFDPTPVSLSATSLVLGWGLFSYRLFDVTAIAYETVFNAIGDGVVVTDSRGRITSVNPVALDSLGREVDDVLGKPIQDLYASWPSTGALGAPAQELIQISAKRAGRERDVEIRAFPVYDGERRLYGRVYISQDVTDRNAYQRRIEEMAYRDFLTSLPNRRALYSDAKRAIAFARRRRLDVALLFIDLDRFKDINDALGHPAGDLLLQYVASRLQATARKEDTLARLGGDEFALLLYDCDAAGAQAVAERLVHALREPAFEVRRTRLHLDASVGIALYSGGEKTVEDLLVEADVALYQAKEGPGRIHLYQAIAPPEIEGFVRPEDEFRDALRLHQLHFKYQPIVDLQTGNVLAVEALVRWEHPTRGLTHPSQFLAMVEERDLALDLDRYALTQATAEVVDSPFDVCINLSARSVLDRQIVDIVAGALRESGLPPRRLILEITERVLAVPELTRPVLFELRKLGVRIAADDFGTGYSALAYLRHFPLSMLKLDRFLVAGIGRRVEDEAIIRAVIMIARTMGLVVIGEGVETREQQRWLEAQGCNAAQGFHLARPERWDTVLAWAESRAGARRLKLVG
jgi:diguanylate cyclase (GGDEF)-like protein/PAS domain S-box-containing protein